MHVSSGPSLQRRADPPYLSIGPPRSPIGPPVTPSDPLLLPYTPLASSRGLTLHSAGRRVASEEGDVAVVHQDRDQDGGGDPPHQALPFWTPALGLQAPWRGRLCHSASHPAGEGEGGYGGESSAWHRIVRCHIFDRDQNKAAVSERYLGRVSHRQFQFGNVCCARVCLQLYIHLFRYSVARNVQSFQQRLPFKFWKRRKEWVFISKQTSGHCHQNSGHLCACVVASFQLMLSKYGAQKAESTGNFFAELLNWHLEIFCTEQKSGHLCPISLLKAIR